MRTAACTLVALLVALATPLPAAEQPAPAAAPRVTKVVLYKHGMGYIERQGRVNGTAVLSLAFRADQMKDLLKSFYAVDLSGGRISSVQYETADPLARQLREILITVPEQAALSQFLMQLKGARISVKAAGESIEGRILGTEPTSEVVAGTTVRQGFRLVILTDAGPIRSTDLLGISEFSLADESLRRDLRRLLDLTLDAKYTDRKKLTLTAAGSGEREVRIGYLVEMPVWKASYRLILDPRGDPKSVKTDESSFLQGWAQAENTTEEDWTDVTLSFVAGNPFSFLMDLYSPLYVKRPQAAVPGLNDLAVDWGQAARPETGVKEERSAMAEAFAPAPARAMKSAAAFANIAQSMDQVGGMAPPPAAGPLGDLLSAAGAGAQGARVGELFSYTALDRVSIPRGQAALVPIVSRAVTGRRVVYYKPAFSPKPCDAWVLRNDSDLTFEAGPVAFFEGSTSLGEGILGHTLPPGSQEVVPYASDASVDVTPQSKVSPQPYFRGKLVDGMLTVTRGETLATSWKLVNRGKEPATLWLNQPKNPLYKLSRPEKPLKEVDDHYRFEVALAPGESRDFAVEETREVQELVDVGRDDGTQVRFFASETYLSPATRALLADVGALMAKKASLSRQVGEWQAQTSRLAEEENRLRKNVDSTRSDTPAERDLRARWMKALSAAEDDITALRGRIDEASRATRQLEEELAKKVREFKGE
jgi:hypothetical protein